MSAQTLTSTSINAPTTSARYQASLHALTAYTPNTATLLRAATPPAEWIATSGRDGVHTYCRPRPDGAMEWLGRTSMPTVTAAAMLSNFIPADCNIALPGIGTGYEAIKILARMPQNCALFVFEPDPWRAALVLGLVDLIEPLRDGRMLLFVGNHREPDLIDFFRRCDGYRFPEQMVQFATQDPASQQDCQALLGRAAVPVTQRQANTWHELAQRLLGRSRQTPIHAEPQRIAVLTCEANDATANLAAGLVASAERAGWDCVGALNDHPSRGHHLARLRAVAEHHSDWVLALNETPDALRKTLSAAVPVVNWRVGDSASASIRPPIVEESNHVVFTADAAGADAVAEAPDASGVRLLEIGVHAERFCPNESDTRRPDDDGCDVCIIADLPSREPEAIGFTQASERRIWQAIMQSCAGGGTAGDLLCAERHLAEALRETGLTLEDEKLRERFIHKISTHAAPHAAMRRVVGALRTQTGALRVCGDGWDAIDPPIQAQSPLLADNQQRYEILRATKVLVVPWFGQTSAELILQSIVAGSCPVTLQPADPLEMLHPQLAEVLRLVPQATSTDEVAVLTQQLLLAPPIDRLNAARRLILDKHTLNHRLESLKIAARRCAAHVADIPGN